MKKKWREGYNNTIEVQERDKEQKEGYMWQDKVKEAIEKESKEIERRERPKRQEMGTKREKNESGRGGNERDLNEKN